MANFYSDNTNLKFHLDHPLMEKIVRLKEKDFVDKETYDYAPLDFEDAMDSYDKVLEIVGEICGDILAVNAESVDTEGPILENNRVRYARGTQENLDAINRSGLNGFSLPRKFGGLNFSLTPYVMAAEIISRADASFVNIFGLQDCAETLNEFATEELREEYLPRFPKGDTAAMVLTEPDAGSDLQAVQLKATFDEKSNLWRLNGVKRFITNGNAEISLVLARSEVGTNDARGLSLFVFDRDETVTVRRIEHKLGIVGSPTCELVFKDSPARLVGDRKLGLIKYVMSLMNAARLGIGAQSVGISEAAYREALKYAQEREQFGKPIIQFPAVYEMLTNMKVNIDAIRTLLYETCRFVDVYKAYIHIEKDRKLEQEEKLDAKTFQKNADVFTPLLKLISSEYCNKIAYDAIQVHGGTGYMKDFPIERIYRDARITSIYEGTTQLQVVAAIKGVGSNAYFNIMKEYESRPIKSDLDYLRKYLIAMTEEYAQTVEKVTFMKDNEYYDFNARRMVEMAGNIIMGYLLLFDANREESYKNSAEIFIRKGSSENHEKATFIEKFD